MNNTLREKVALVTGGASGIGRATALALAAEGAYVVVADVDEAGGQAVVAEIGDLGGQAFFQYSDVSQAADVVALIEAIVGRYGRIDCAVNNAGIEGLPARTADTSEADFDRIMAINVKGVWLCMKHEIQRMITQGGGVIVNMASVAGLVGAHSLPVYAASKHAVVGLTKSAALEYARKNIRVNAVCPSVVRTPMVERAVEIMPQFAEATIKGNPSRRLGEPEEVAAAVVWLCSDASSFTNGATVTVDGGFTAQ